MSDTEGQTELENGKDQNTEQSAVMETQTERNKGRYNTKDI